MFGKLVDLYCVPCMGGWIAARETQACIGRVPWVGLPLSQGGFQEVNALRFFKHFVSRPGEVGAVSASSEALASVMTARAGVRGASSVLELGPGTGAITRCIETQRSESSDFFAIEMNSEFVSFFQERFPHLRIVQGSASDATRHLSEAGMGCCDAIVSSLPFASFEGGTQDAILSEVLEALTDEGRFVTFTYLHSCYLPAGRHFREKLFQRFGHVDVSPIVWKSLPPAYVYCAVK